MADLKQYWQEIAQKAGIPAERVQAISDALGDEQVSKAFANGFVTRSDYSRDLDKTRDEWKGKLGQYEQWYQQTALPAHQQAVEAARQAQLMGETLSKYRSTYGELDGSAPPQNGHSGLTLDQVQRLLDERMGQYTQGSVRVSKVLAKANVDHYKRFGEPLPDEFEEFAIRSGKDPETAYSLFIRDRVKEQEAQAEAKRAAEFEGKLKAAREEGYRDALTKRGLPTEVKTELSPLRSYMGKTRDDVAKTDDNAAYRSFIESYNSEAARSA